MDYEVKVEKKSNKALILIIALIAILAIGVIGFVVWKNNQEDTKTEEKTEKKKNKEMEEEEDNEEEDEEDIKIEDEDEGNDTPVVIPDWGNKYASYIRSTFGSTTNPVKGYFLDLMNDKTPELIIFEFDEREHSTAAILYLENGIVKKTPQFKEAHLSLLFDISNQSFDGWYMVSFDEKGNDVYSYAGELLGNTSTKKSFKITNEQEEKNFERAYIDTPFDLKEYSLQGSSFDDKVLSQLVKQYNNEKVPSEDIMDYIKETIESRRQ